MKMDWGRRILARKGEFALEVNGYVSLYRHVAHGGISSFGADTANMPYGQYRGYISEKVVSGASHSINV